MLLCLQVTYNYNVSRSLNVGSTTESKLSPHTMAAAQEACPTCGVRLSEKSMRFHRQVCGAQQAPQPQAIPPVATKPSAGPPPAAGSRPVSDDRISERESVLQQRREEMRRSLNALREEVYGSHHSASSSRQNSTAPGQTVPSGGLEAELKILQHPSPPKRRVVQGRAPPTQSGSEEDASGGELSSDFRLNGQRQPSSANDNRRSPGAPRTAQPPTSATSDGVSTRQLLGIVESQARDIARLSATVDRLQNEVIDLRDQRSSRQVEASPIVSEVRTDLHTLGRHVDALRDDIDAMRSTDHRRLRETEDRLSEVQATVRLLEERFAQSEAVHRTAPSATLFDELRRDVDHLRHDLLSCRTSTNELREDVGLVRRERESASDVRGELKHVTRDVDTLHSDMSYSKRQMSEMATEIARLVAAQSQLPAPAPGSKYTASDAERDRRQPSHDRDSRSRRHALPARHSSPARSEIDSFLANDDSEDEPLPAGGNRRRGFGERTDPPLTYVVGGGGRGGPPPATARYATSSSSVAETDTESIVSRAVYQSRGTLAAPGPSRQSGTASESFPTSRVRGPAVAPVAQVTLRGSRGSR